MSAYEGRNLNLIKISDNVTTDENEPEVLFTCNQHAREHLTTEMCIHIVQRLTAGYATDSAIKKLVDGHEIYLIPPQPELELQVGLLRRFEWQHD